MIDTDMTNLFAGPFCACGDYSCPASDNPTADCVNQDDLFTDPFTDWNGVGDQMDSETWGDTL